MRNSTKASDSMVKPFKVKQRAFCLFLAMVMVIGIFATEAFAAFSVEWLSKKYSWDPGEVFKEGLMVVYDTSAGEGYTNDKTRYGFIDVSGKVVIPLLYENCAGFTEGLSRIRKNGKFGYINKAGKEVVPPKYDYAMDFHDGLAIVQRGNKYGYIDKTGKEVIPLIYKGVSEFRDGIAAVTNENSKIGFINKSGKLLVQTNYTDYSGRNIGQFNEGLCPVYEYEYDPDGSILRYGFIDTTGKMVINAEFSDYGMLINPYKFVGGVSGVFLIDEDDRLVKKYIDKKGNFVSDPEELCNDLVIIYDQEKYGAKKAGKYVVPAIYDYLHGFIGGLSAAARDGKSGMIDTTGKTIVPFEYDSISSYGEGVVFVRKNGKVGIIKGLSFSSTTLKAPTVNPVSDNEKSVKGKTQASATVYVKRGNTVIGSSKAKADGSFVIAIPIQKAGVKLSITAVDKDGKTSKAAQVTVIDKTPPPVPVVNPIKSTTALVTGTAEAGCTVVIKSGSTVIGSGVSNSKGLFSIAIKAQKAGTTLSITAKDKSGNVSGAKKVVVAK